MSDKKCPNCGLWSVSSAMKCDCGYVFPVVQTRTPSQASSASTPTKLPDPTKEENVVPETKKCPYCAEIIKYEAIVCRYCGRDLAVRPKQPTILESKIATKDPPTGLSLFFGVLMLVAIYGVAYLIGLNWAGSDSDLKSTLSVYQAGVMLVITLLAVPGLNPEKRNFLRYVSIFILSVIPIMGWIVIYWAGKQIARLLT